MAIDDAGLTALRTLLDPRVVAAWLDEVEGYRRTANRVESRPATAPTSVPVEKDPERLLTVKELAERLNVKTSWVYGRVSAGTIPCIHVGRYVRFRWSEINVWTSSENQD